MNKREAMQYLYAKGPGKRRVKDEDGDIWLLKEDGNVVNQRGSDYFGLIPGVAYSPIEPQKTNEKLAEELRREWLNGTTRDFAERLLDVKDKKIEEAK